MNAWKRAQDVRAFAAAIREILAPVEEGSSGSRGRRLMRTKPTPWRNTRAPAADWIQASSFVPAISHAEGHVSVSVDDLGMTFDFTTFFNAERVPPTAGAEAVWIPRL